MRAARRLEGAAYRDADRIIVLSSAFTRNLVAKGVPESKIELIYDPATRAPGTPPRTDGKSSPPRVLSMGNIGHSQGLAPLVKAFEASRALDDTPVELVITGNGMAAEDVRAEIRTDRVRMVGLVDDAELERQLHESTIAFVSQDHKGAEFNIPSKIMNFMAYGLPVLAAVNPAGEVAKIVEEAGAGWVVDSSRPETFPQRLAEILRDPEDVVAGARASLAYAERHFTKPGFAARFDESPKDLVRGPTRAAA